MTRYVIRRLLLSILTLFLLTTIVFLIVNVLPDDVGRSILGPFASQETVDALNEEIGANDPLLQQYGRLLKSAVTFDWGDSYQSGVPVTDLLWPAFWRSAKLAAYGLVLTIPIAIAAGMYAARRRNTIADRSIVTLGLASSSIPDFVSGVTLQYFIGVKLGWFPVLALAPPGFRVPHPARLPHAPGARPGGRLLRVHRPDDEGRHDAGARRRLHRTAVMKGLPRAPCHPRATSRATPCSRPCRSSACRSATSSAASSPSS